MEDILKGFIFETAPTDQPAIIKVIGVGGGGGNAVKHMYTEGIKDVTFALCNTDKQVLISSSVPVKLQLGEKLTGGLGAGAEPQIGKEAAEESIPEIRRMLSDGTKMALITAAMGGGTGTGAAPIVAQVAKEMDLLTIGIVTIPFMFEGAVKIGSALKGAEEMRKNVDALLVINNERLPGIYADLDVKTMFKRADEVLATAAKSIADIITIEGEINVDFADVRTTLKEGGIAVMNNGYGSGEGRVYKALTDALKSPLLNNDNAFQAKKILFYIYSGSQKPLLAPEINDIPVFMSRFEDKNINVIWGLASDDTLGDEVKITVLASGFGMESVSESQPLEPNQLKLLDKETWEEKERLKREKEQQDEENGRLKRIYYGPEAHTPKTKVFIFSSLGQLDDDVVIETLLNTPTLDRNPDVMKQVIYNKPE
ncbi:MAG: cell division protein FtsZ [Candidatus Symbiothrix sp.]|jgi:cell division protein FtsZ|nr:cell division protein FtsZ [Candidatus Symbiothrix sp.]